MVSTTREEGGKRGRNTKCKQVSALRKGILTKADLKKRKVFAAKVIKRLRGDFWTIAGICFYLDGASFTHKYNPQDEARCHGSKAWKKASEAFEVTAKGKKEGTGGRMASFYVAISYEKGVVMCEQYEGHINGRLFADIVKEKFPETFSKSTNCKNMLFLQDGDSFYKMETQARTVL